VHLCEPTLPISAFGNYGTRLGKFMTRQRKMLDNDRDTLRVRCVLAQKRINARSHPFTIWALKIHKGRYRNQSTVRAQANPGG
jgi:hypothetical protein